MFEKVPVDEKVLRLHEFLHYILKVYCYRWVVITEFDNLTRGLPLNLDNLAKLPYVRMDLFI